MRKLWKRVRPRGSLYGKLIVSFLMLVVPLYGISLRMNESGSASVRNEIANSTSTRVQFYMEQLELEFSKIIKLSKEYVTDDDVMKLSVASEVMEDFERTRAILRLQKQMQLLKESSSYVSKASLHFYQMQRTISSGEGVGPIPQDEFSALSAPADRYTPFRFYKNRLFISYTYPEYTSSSPLYLLVVEINRKELIEVLSRFTDIPGGGAILADNRGGWTLSGTGNNGMDEAITSRLPAADTGTGIVTQVIGKERFFTASRTSSMLGTTLFMYLPEKAVLGPLNKYRVWTWVLSLVALIAILFVSYVIYRLIHRPLRTLVRAFRAVEQGNLTRSVHHPAKDEFAYLFIQYNAMVDHLRVLIHEVYEQRYRANISEFRQLQAQINPHFLYNSFFTLSHIAQNEEYDSVVRFTRYLGEYFKFITRDGSEEVTLQAEMNFARTFTDIQAFRFSHRIQVRFEDPPVEFESLRVPRLIVQPILENAYNYGLENKKRDGVIQVCSTCDDRFVTIVVEDNGDELTDERLLQLRQSILAGPEPLETTGLVNIHRRLRLRFGEDASLQLSRSELGGLKVRICIPRERV
ncbi:sensor histidine kinase [Paenibacillus sp. HJGM_3]|uniref:sensor histidine kinase n=1 Tax=Paenibacillus sp. HJGM_3 TaxID=3379816 RepID=UPI003858BBA2